MPHITNVDPIAEQAVEVARKERKPWPLPVVLAAALLVPLLGGIGIIGGWAWQRFGTASAAAAFLRGEPFLLEPRTVALGPIPAGEQRALTLRASNLTARTINVYGPVGFCSRAGCLSCLDRLPLEIAPRSTREVTFKATAPEASGSSMRLETALYTSLGNYEFAITGKVTGDGPERP